MTARGPLFDRRRYLLRAHGSRRIVVDPHGAHVAGPFGQTEARREAVRLNIELASREKCGPRPCLRYDREFNSAGIQNRMCDPCRNAATTPPAMGWRSAIRFPGGGGLMAGPTRMQQSRVPVADVIVRDRLRPVSEAGVANLIASIPETGVMKDAIHIRKKKDGRQYPVADAHPLDAAAQLGWEVSKPRSGPTLRMTGPRSRKSTTLLPEPRWDISTLPCSWPSARRSTSGGIRRPVRRAAPRPASLFRKLWDKSVRGQGNFGPQAICATGSCAHRGQRAPIAIERRRVDRGDCCRTGRGMRRPGPGQDRRLTSTSAAALPIRTAESAMENSSARPWPGAVISQKSPLFVSRPPGPPRRRTHPAGMLRRRRRHRAWDDRSPPPGRAAAAGQGRGTGCASHQG